MLCGRMLNTMDTLRVRAGSNPSQRIIAAGIVIAFCYWAASVVMTLLLSVLLAYLLDPLVEWLEVVHVRRAIGAMAVLLIALAFVAGLGYMVFDRLDHFATDWPKYSAVLRQASSAVERRLERLESRVSELSPEEQQRRPPQLVRLEGERPVRSLVLRGLGSLYIVLLEASFVPFLVFFMLAAKHDVWHATLQLFPASQRTQVKETLDEVSVVLRGFVVGNVLVTALLALASWVFFWMIGLDYPFLAGVVSALLNLVPYLGAFMAWLPPFVLGLGKWKTAGPYLGVAVVLSLIHLISINVLMPALVGRRVRLNALAVTVALLFWGWLWGAMGLILAIPITATTKVICDNVPSWRPVGRWLGA